MGFFKDFKEDFNDAVNEMVPGGDASEEVMVNTLDGEIDVESELSKLDGLLEQVAKKVDNDEQPTEEKAVVKSEPVVEAKPVFEKKEENKRMDTVEMTNAFAPSAPASDENAIITAGMKINGNLESAGSIEVQGTIQGNVSCNGKLVVTGNIMGNSSSAEFFADAAKIEGEVVTTGTVKVGVGSVIIGNISATSAVIAGAVKGDIDVNGPVVVDTSAVIMGNIKSRSVQINNGAVIEGFCSQAYSDVDVEGLFK